MKNHVDWRFTYKTKRRKTHWKCLPERKGRYNANALLFIDDVLGWPLTAPPKKPRKKTEKITGSYLPFPRKKRQEKKRRIIYLIKNNVLLLGCVCVKVQQP